jgi:hypothetical protein
MGLSFSFSLLIDSYTFLFPICCELESDVSVLVSFLTIGMPSEILYACPVITCKLLGGLEARNGFCSPRLDPEPQSP